MLDLHCCKFKRAGVFVLYCGDHRITASTEDCGSSSQSSILCDLIYSYSRLAKFGKASDFESENAEVQVLHREPCGIGVMVTCLASNQT